MFTGIGFAIAACFIWGMIFVIPIFIHGYNAIEITIARYLFYGCISLFFCLLRSKKIFPFYSLRMWGKAFVFALTANVLYYLAIIIAVRSATPPVTILTVGLVPIIVAFYGNWQMRECQFRCLIFPALGIALGMLLVNFMAIDWSFQTHSVQKYMLGLLCAFWALFTWSWYAVSNARFLKRNPSVNPGDWSTLMGVGSLFWALLLLGIVSLGWHAHIEWSKYVTPSKTWMVFILATLFLGTVCSWGGAFFWNRACTYLPMSLAGPMIIFETLFGLTFAYLVQLKMPSMIEFLGVSAMVAGITYIVISIRKSRVQL